VVIAAVDEKSIDQLGRWPWPYTVQAELVNRLTDYGARVITFDVVFSSSDTSGGIETLRKIKANMKTEEVEARTLLNRAIAAADHDRIFAQALKRSRRTILGMFFHFSKKEIQHLSETENARHLANIRNSKYNAIKKAPNTRLIDIALPSAVAVESNIDVLSASARGSAFFSLNPDSDGAIRRYPLIVKYRDFVEIPGDQDYLFSPLAVRSVERFLRGTTIFWIDPIGVEKIAISGRKKIIIPTNTKGELLINYLGPSGTFPQYSIVDIIKRRKELAPPSAFKQKMVLIGPTAIALSDLRVTPYDKAIPGVNIHATVIDNLMNNNFLEEPWWADLYAQGVILFLGLFGTFILPHAGAIKGGIVSVGAFLFTFALNYFLFTQYGWWLSAAYPILTILFVYTSMSLFHLIVEERDKRFIQGAFSTYLSPKVVAELVENPDLLALGGVRKEITAFFSDVAGFTSVSESMSPEELVHLLNEYLSEMTEIILRYDGTVDKYEGDAIIAFFGAPHPMPDHAAQCCFVALDMQARMVEMRKEWREKDMKELYMRIGLNTGPAVVGNMGSSFRMDYTMMGDTVNQAARFEGANKQYGSSILIGQTTYDEAKHVIEARELDLINVVGKKMPVPIYELVGRKGELEPSIARGIELYREGLEKYRAREFERAMDLFSECLILNKNDGPTKGMLKRCEEYIVFPPPENWNGAFQMTSK
jgi:adenylate cyclase